MSNNPLRLFIAVDLPLAVKALLREQQSRLRPRAGAIRWADTQGTHLTLFFMGATREAQLDSVTAALSDVAAAGRPFELRTGALGAFPDLRRPRVVWLGIEGELGALAALQAAVERAIVPLGFPREERPFAPHLTLGRARRDAVPSELGAVSRALSESPMPRSAGFAVHDIVLMRSERLPEGARYSVVQAFRLGHGGTLEGG